MASSPEELEKQLHRVLRALPERSAPASLEARVMARIAPPAPAAWWRRSYAFWPQPLRLAFLVVSAGAAAAVAVMLGRLMLPAQLQFDSAASAGNSLFAWWRGLVTDLTTAGAATFRQIPSVWLYSVGAVMAASYAALVSLGSAVYRSFFRPASFSS